MKRKFILILAVMMFCTGIYVAAKGLQSKIISETQIVADNNLTDNQKNNGNKSSESQSTGTAQEQQSINNSQNQQKNDAQTKNTQTNSESKTQKQPEVVVNFKIIDSVNGKTILLAGFDLENKTVAEVTLKILDSKGISYRAKGAGDTFYISSIAGLTERQAGPESGWCYYVNGVKYNIGAGSYKLKKDDILEWKYLKDGISR